jgi:hypothetical protein
MRLVIPLLLVVGTALAPASAQQTSVVQSPGGWVPGDRDDATSARDAYLAVGERFGVEVTFDPRFRNEPVRVPDVDGLPLETALRRLGTTTGSFAVRQPDGSMVVAHDTPQNRMQYEPLEIRSFAVRYRDVSEIDKALRSLIEARRVNTDATGGTVTLRDTVPKLCLAERILEVLDRPPAEIDITVEVLELPEDDLPLCARGPCARVARDAMPRSANRRWMTTVPTVGAKPATHRVELPLADGDQLIAALRLTARHLPALDFVELHVALEAGVVSETSAGARKLGTETDSTVRLAAGEISMIRIPRPAPDAALVLLLEPAVRRPDPWGGMDPVRFAVGTEARLTADCGPPAVIP